MYTFDWQGHVTTRQQSRESSWLGVEVEDPSEDDLCAFDEIASVCDMWK